MPNFDKQIKNAAFTNRCMKEAQQLNVLQRLSKLLSVETRLLIFKSFIQSNFNYCPLVWHFCSETNTDKFLKNTELSGLIFMIISLAMRAF